MEFKAVWIGKAICLASRYPYFDYFQQILEDLYLRVKCGS
jgi:DENN (AEX-3) domain